MTARATYVYGIVASARRPPLARAARGLPGTGPVRWLDVAPGLFLAVADAPLDQYGEDAIHRGLGDLQWVSRVAVAHEAVVEALASAATVLPMKLFTIFTTDERALAHVRGERRRITAAVKRVAGHQEWSARLVLARTPAPADKNGKSKNGKVAQAPATGAAYLSRKKVDRDLAGERVKQARETVTGIYERLAARSRLAKQRPPDEAAPGLLLDAAFLVPRTRTASFSALATREAHRLSRLGYGLTVTGPWPPYTFVQD